MSNYNVKVSGNQNYRATYTGTVAPRKFIQLTDVNMINVQDGDIVIYEESTKTFIPISRNSIVFEIVDTTNLNVSGIATVGEVTINSSGIITSTNPGISTIIYYGDGSQLIGINAADIAVQLQDLISYPVYPTFASDVGFSSLTISKNEFSYIPSSGNLGIGTNNPTSKLYVQGNGYFVGIVTANSFIGSLIGIANTATNVIGGIGSLTTLRVSGISTFNNLDVTSVNASGIVTALSFVPSSGYIKAPDGTDSFYIYSGTGNVSFQGTIGASQINNASGYKVIGFAGTDVTLENNVYISGVTTSVGGFFGSLSGTATTSTNVIGGIGSLNSLSVAGISTLGIVTTSNIFSTGIITATQFSTGSNGIGVNNNTIFGPSIIIIDPAGIGDNSGIVRIAGDFYVDGTQTIINSTTLEVADLQIGIGTTAFNDIVLDGAGIGIGSTGNRKTFVWEYSTSSLKSSENINLTLGKTYKINGIDVLSSNTLGSGVVNSSLTSVGTLNQLNVSGITTTSTLNVGTGGTIFRATSSGLVGVGTIIPTQALDVVGNINASGTVTANSDSRLKENIKTISDALEKVLSLRGVEYDKIDTGDHQIGVIAQEVEKIIPEVVYGNEIKSVAYANLVGLLIEAIKEQNQRIDELERRLGEL